MKKKVLMRKKLKRNNTINIFLTRHKKAIWFKANLSRNLNQNNTAAENENVKAALDKYMINDIK